MEKRSARSKLLWFVGLWLGGVLITGVVALLIKLALA